MNWQDAIQVKDALDELGVRILALEQPSEGVWRVVYTASGHVQAVTVFRDWCVAVYGGKVPGITPQMASGIFLPMGWY